MPTIKENWMYMWVYVGIYNVESGHVRLKLFSFIVLVKVAMRKLELNPFLATVRFAEEAFQILVG